MSSLLIKNADAIVTCDSQDAVLEHANLLMQDGIITYIGIEPQTADEVIDGTGCLVYPGLIILTTIFTRRSAEIFRKFRTWNCSTGLQHCTRFGKI